jgi:serine/threonine-protein kinase
MADVGSVQNGKAERGDSTLSLRRNGRLGKYRLVKRLGKGGYCEVWKARDCVEGIWVALKIPNADVNGKRDNEAVLREVRLVANLRHRHIMPIKNAEIIKGHAVFATELSVSTLDDCSRPMSVRKILNIILQILDGLSYAHKKRLVHCDVTPGNIFLFPDGCCALGDFGIGLRVSGPMVTVEDFGTPGYVAPEQAYGRPTYRSDCFSVGLILYEYLTGHLPRWPFQWPMKGVERLSRRTNQDFVKFMKKSLSVDPAKRFANAGEMMEELEQVIPGSIIKSMSLEKKGRKTDNWKRLRRESFTKKYGRALSVLYKCAQCGEPVSESMVVCPWCGSDKNRYDKRTVFTHICIRCHRGISPAWSYCPWCYGLGYEPVPEESKGRIRYHDRCKYCNGGLMRFMRYCPWCRRKVKKAWDVWPFTEVCGNCGWSVDSEYWNYCPWCDQNLK